MGHRIDTASADKCEGRIWLRKGWEAGLFRTRRRHVKRERKTA